jgi:hypothetical protein
MYANLNYAISVYYKCLRVLIAKDAILVQNNAILKDKHK